MKKPNKKQIWLNSVRDHVIETFTKHNGFTHQEQAMEKLYLYDPRTQEELADIQAIKQELEEEYLDTWGDTDLRAGDYDFWVYVRPNQNKYIQERNAVNSKFCNRCNDYQPHQFNDEEVYVCLHCFNSAKICLYCYDKGCKSCSKKKSKKTLAAAPLL